MNPSEPPALFRWFVVFSLFVLFILAARFFAWFIVPCFLALVLYYFLSPLANWLECRGLSRPQSVYVIFILLGLIALLFLPSLVQPLFEARTDVAGNVKKYLTGSKELLLSLIDAIQKNMNFFGTEMARASVENKLNNYFHENLAQKLPAVILSALAFVPILLLVPFTTFFLLRDGRDFKKSIVKGIPNAFFERALFLFYRVDRQVTDFLRGVFIEAVTIGILIGSGFYLIESVYVDHPQNFVLVGFLAALFNLIPYLGPLLVFLFATVLASIDTQQPQASLFVAFLFVITKLLDDFLIAPLVVGKSMKLHPVAVVFALFIGGEIAGFGGLLLALPVLGITLVIFDVLYLTFHDRRLRLRHRHTRLTRFHGADVA